MAERKPPLITTRDRFKVVAALLTQVGVTVAGIAMTGRPVAAGIAAGAVMAGVAGALTHGIRHCRNSLAAQSAQDGLQDRHKQRDTPQSETTEEMVRRLAQKAKLTPAPVTHYVNSIKAHISAIAAFTFGKPPAIEISSTYSRNFAVDEIETVLAHEIMHGVGKHFRESSASISLGVTNFVLAAYLLCTAPKASQGFIAAGLYVTNRLARRSISHSHEWQADRGAVILTGKPAALAAMYEKIKSLHPKPTGRRKILETVKKYWRIYPPIDTRLARVRKLSDGHAPR